DHRRPLRPFDAHVTLLLAPTPTRYRGGMQPRGRPLAVAALAMATVLLTSCAGSEGSASPATLTGAPTPALSASLSPTRTPGLVKKIAVAYDISGRGDGGFNDI